MAERNYIVLRNPGGKRIEVLGGGDGETGAAELEIESADLDAAGRADAHRDPEVVGIAEPMPLALIEPFDSDAETGAPGPTWGVEAVGATESPFSGAGVKVAVLDTGIDPNHEAFAGVTLERRNFTTEPDDDSNGHGTHCAGTIFGRDVGGSRIGVATGVSEAMIAKVLGAGGGTSASLSEAIMWAVSGGANVVSMSLGIDFPGFVKQLVDRFGLDVRPATSIALEEYRANVNLFSQIAGHVRALGAFGQPALVIAASGNESRRPEYEIAVAPPAAATGFVSVGALASGTDGLTVATFSNSNVDLAAPGVDVSSAAVGGGLSSLSGTSMATPHVAGIAALWTEKLREEQDRVDSEIVRAELVASGIDSTLRLGFDREAVGSGLVQAPR